MNPPDLPSGRRVPAIPSLSDDEAEPHFYAPWQATAFALTVSLHETGLFTWPEWVAVFGSHLDGHLKLPTEADAADHAERYYGAWLGALEEVLQDRQITDPETLRQTAETWQLAARATPHGRPIVYCAGERKLRRGTCG